MHNMDDLVDSIMELAGPLQNRMRDNLPLLSKEIDAIIKTKDTSVRRVEALLDVLLDYAMLGVGDSEFHKLNRYYSSFQPENARFYEEFYKEMTEG